MSRRRAPPEAAPTLRVEVSAGDWTGDANHLVTGHSGVVAQAERAGLRRIGWHTLRHSFASHLVMKGVQLKAVQELLGHATIDMTMRYAHLSPNVTRDAVKVLDAPHASPSADHAGGAHMGHMT